LPGLNWMVNTQQKRSSLDKLFPFILIGIGVSFLFSCTSIQQAIIQGKPVAIRIERHGDAWTDPSQFYVCEVKRNGGEHEFHVTKDSNTVIYLLPSAKLTLLYEMEMAFKDLHQWALSYYLVIVQSYKTKRSYRINTDIVANFITGLKKK